MLACADLPKLLKFCLIWFSPSCRNATRFQQKTLPLGDYRLGPPMRKPAAAPGRPSQARRARTREKYTREDDVT